ncbi:MAG: hypothetical protein R3B07_06870 [Polyangiaceae bacterium]
MPLASRHAALLLTALLLLACGGQHAAPAVVVAATPELEPAPRFVAPTWRNSAYGIEVPCTDDELDDLESHSPGVIYLGSRVVSIATSAPNATAAFQQVSGPVSILLQTLDEGVLSEVEALAKRHPVLVKVDRGVGHQVKPLSQLRYIDGLRLDDFASEVELDWSAFKRLRWLSLTRAWNTSRTLPRLPKTIERLWLAGDHDDTTPLTELTRLKSLSMDLGALPSLATLDTFKELRELTAAGAIRDQDLQHLSRLEHLESFSTQSVNVSNRGVHHLVAASSLKRLRIPRGINDDGLKELAQLKHLAELELGDSVTDKGMQEVARFEQLEKLTLDSEARVTDAGIKLLRSLKLRELDLAGLPLTDEVAETLARFNELRRLNLNHTRITGKTARQLPRSLRVLDLGYTILDSSAVGELARLTNLRALSLMFVQFDDAAFAKLAKLQGLRRLVFSSNDLTPASKTTLLSLPHLSLLNSSGSLGCAGMELTGVTCDPGLR